MVEWHRPNLDPEEIAKIIREGREENDKKFDSYAEYADYIYKDNERILKGMEDKEFEVEKNAMIDFEEVLDELRKDRDERDDYLVSIVEMNEVDMDELIEDNMDETFISSVDGSEVSFKDVMKMVFKDNKEILDKLGSDFDEDGKAYWEKWEKDGGRKESDDI